MDDQRFDNLSRIIARSTTRRTTIKGIAAAIGGGVFAGVFGVRAQRAGAQGTGEPGSDCESGDDCASGQCSDGGVCYCVDPARPWLGCDCNTGTEAPCDGGSLVCCATGAEPGGPGICTSASVGCEPTGECSSDPGEACETDADCCTGTCSDEGVCFCSDPSRPWIGCPCNTGTEGPCGGGSELCCPTGSEPGGPGVCTSSMAGCQTPGECTASGDACASSAECCDELVCLDSGICGIATTVVLPSTGSGMSNDSNLGTWVGAAAVAGAAAVIAGRKLNPKPAEGSDES